MPFLDLKTAAQDPINILLAQTAATLFSLLLGFSWLRITDWKNALGIHPVPCSVLLGGAVLGAALQFPLTELTNWLQVWFPVAVEEQLAFEKLLHPDGAWLMAVIGIAIVVAAPIGEELIFRGLIFRGLIRNYRPALAVLLSAILFGIAHMAPTRFVYATLMGIVLSVVVLRTGSVLPSIASHAAFNAMPVLLPKSVVRLPGFNVMSTHIEHLPTWLILSSSLLFILSFVWMMRHPSAAPLVDP
ncbi:MAG: CPBP family intramembrane metalloprotease [Myxococcales bacterium]|nr:CPBP family intramembrane metalloprotease [Myxococcales bacterium]